MSPCRPDPPSSEAGQGTVEYVGLILFVAVVLAVGLSVAGPVLPGGEIARAVAAKLICAAGGEGECRTPSELVAASPLDRAYGSDISALLADRAPDIYFEDDDFVSLPVDYRECRRRECADSINPGHVRATQTGLAPTAYVHVVDCRDGAANGGGYDCSGARAGNVYLQYWLYYPDSETHGLGRLGGYHLDDWESYQVRVDASGSAVARASSHHGYNGREGDISSDTGWDLKPGWDTILNALHVAAGSHAGMTQPSDDDSREIPRADLRLIPLERIAASGEAPPFAISPPWEKSVWLDPEATGT